MKSKLKMITTEVDPELWRKLKIECAEREMKIHEAFGIMLGWFLSYKPTDADGGN